MYASDYRRIARDALRGKWKKMALFILLAGLLGATGGLSLDGPSVNMQLNGAARAQWAELLRALATVSAVLGIYQLLIGSWTRVGLYAMCNRVLDGDAPRAGMLFPRCVFWRSVGMNLLRSIYVFLWSMLFVVPGILAAYSYSMADYLLSRNPEMGVSEALRESKRLMYGRRWRLFCLEISFIGWMLLCMVPMYLLSAGAMLILEGFGSADGLVLWMLIAMLISMVATVFVDVYSYMAVVAFFRDAERGQAWQQQARQGWEENAQRYDGDSFGSAPSEDGDGPEYSYADETAAREMFVQYGCSRKRMRDAGVLEQFEAYHVDASSEQIWLRRYGNELIVRFSHDPEALDEILDLAAEYALEELLIRALERIDRHIRRQTLPDVEILNMAGRVLALVVSGTFDEHPDFVQRRREQVADMADRLEERLRAQESDGGWQRTLQLVRQMCG